MLVACAVVLLAGLVLQLVAYRHGGHQSLSDIPRIVLHRRLQRGMWPYVDRVLEYPVLAGVLAWVAVTIWSSPLGALVVLALGGYGEHEGRDGRAWADWEEEGEGRSPQEVPLPDDLPG